MSCKSSGLSSFGKIYEIQTTQGYRVNDNLLEKHISEHEHDKDISGIL